MVADPLRELARRHGPRRALVDRSAGFRMSWFELDDLAHTWARRFEAEGLRAGQRVAVLEPGGARFAALLHACLRSGAAMVPISTRAPEAEVLRVLSDSRPRLIVREGDIEALPGAAAGHVDDRTILYTSGTTGEPKGVRLTLANHAASARGCQQVLGSSENDRWLAVLSPHHVGGLAIYLRAVMSNQPLITLARFEERAVLAAVEAERPTLVSLVPTMLNRLLETGGLEALRGLRAILVGSAPASAELVRRWADLGLKVCPTYGLTETSSQVALVPPGRAAELAGSAGLICPHASVSIAEGEIGVSGPSVSPGYVNPSLQPSPAGGSFATGDIGRLEGNVLTVVGRRDDTIITGGENVRPEEVEAVLRAHPSVVDAGVSGVPDEAWGEVVAAWVAAEASTAAADLELWCRERLPAYKVPRRWAFVDNLPVSEGGKLLRRLLPTTGQPAPPRSDRHRSAHGP